MPHPATAAPSASAARHVAAAQAPSTSSLSSLRALAEPSTVTTPEQLLVRLRQLEAALRGDGRVVFPAIYAVITRASVKTIADGRLEDTARARALIVDFGRRFLDALAAHLDGRPIPAHWRRHFELAAGQRPSLRAAASAINAHLSVDLAESVRACGASRAFAGDYAAFGRALASSTPEVITALGRHGVKADGFLKAWLVGDVVDAVAGAGTTSRLGFQVVRSEAFTAAMLMRDCVQSPALVRAGMNAACAHREALLDVVLGPGPGARLGAGAARPRPASP